MKRPSINPGHVEWSGERHCIFLKTSESAEFAVLITLVRIALSPYGKGNAAFLLASPDQDAGWPSAPNLILTDNQSLARWLRDNWIRKMAPFANRKGLRGSRWLDLQSISWVPGDLKTESRAKLRAPDLELDLIWKSLGPPIPIAVSTSSSETGKHEMHSVIIEADGASAALNGRAIQGVLGNWQRFGLNMSSASLSVSETWITPSG